MRKHLLQYCGRTALLCAESIAIIVLLILLIGGIGLWRLTSSPLSVNFARPYIEDALHDPEGGYGVTLKSVALYWPDVSGPLMLALDDITILQKQIPVLTVDQANLGLATWPLLTGRIAPSRILLSGPALTVIRTPDNDFKIGLEDPETEAPEQEETEQADSSPLTRIIESLSAPETENARSPLKHLKHLEIRGAQLDIDDRVLNIRRNLPDLDLLFTRHERGLMAQAHIRLPGTTDADATGGTLHARALYDRKDKNFHIQSAMEALALDSILTEIHDHPSLKGHRIVVNGTANALISSNLSIEKASVNISSENGFINAPQSYESPLKYDSFRIAGTYDRSDRHADLTSLTLNLQGVTIEMAGQIDITDDSITAPLTLKIPNLPQESIETLWPQSAHDSQAYSWLVEKMSAGRFFDTEASFTITGTKAKEEDADWSTDVTGIKAAFGIENMTVDYRSPLAAGTALNGHGTFGNNTLTIALKSGAIRDLQITKGIVAIDNIIGSQKSMADIDLSLNGPLQTVLRYIADEPIDMKEEDLGLQVEGVEGQAALDLSISFPATRTLLKEQVIVKANGNLTETRLPDVVRDMDLTGGPLALTVDGQTVSLKGPALLEGRPTEMSWTKLSPGGTAAYTSRITASLNADSALRTRLGIGLEDWVEGTIPIKAVYTEYPNERAEVSVEADITPVRVMVKALEQEKPSGVPGTATCTAILKNGSLKEIRDLQVTSSPVRLTNAHLYFQTVNGEDILRRGTIDRAIVGETDVTLSFEIGHSDLLKLSAEGAFLDARPFLSDDEKPGPKPLYEGPPVIATVKVREMRTQPNRQVGDARLYLDLSRQGIVNRFEMDAKSGKGAVYVRLKPDDLGQMALRLEADDAGATLRAFGIYETIDGGRLAIHGEATDPDRPHVIYGMVQLNDFRVTDAPVLARLLSAISPAGLPQLLGDEGIYFARLESDFEWYRRPSGDLYVLTDGRTSGSSLGLTFEGTIDKRKKEMTLSGHVVPVSLVNDLVGDLVGGIPLVGDLLGGKAGIFAATYTVKGTPGDKEPKVSVNPLSALTPGILRRILFEGESE